MNSSTPSARASHVNSGTSVPREELAWPEMTGRVVRMPKLHAEIDERSQVSELGGLALFSAFVRRFGVAHKIDARVNVLKVHLPYHESDHVLAQAANLYAGGTCIEDMANLQNSEPIRRLLGACRLPDPTTGGDFLRRFEEGQNPGSLQGLRSAVDDVQGEVWSKLGRRGGGKRRRKRRELAVIDVDGHQKPLYGVHKEGADFSHTGTWSYQTLLVSMAGTGECLAVRNRPGNLRSSEGAAEVLAEVLPKLADHFEDVLVRADSDFDRRDVREACEAAGAHFAFVGREVSGRPQIAANIEERRWRPFRTRAARQRQQRGAAKHYKARSKKQNRRRRRARQRGYHELALTRQWVAEVPYKPPGSTKHYRLIVRRQRIEHREGQSFLFEQYRYRYVVTNLPATSYSAEDVLDATYQRCDQENLIDQMGSGLAAWRMPVAEFAGNCAWLEIARLAWNIAKWIAQLALPAEVVRWEWKRFRHAFVYLAAQVVKRGRQIWLRLSAAHRFAEDLVAAHRKLQT